MTHIHDDPIVGDEESRRAARRRAYPGFAAGSSNTADRIFRSSRRRSIPGDRGTTR